MNPWRTPEFSLTPQDYYPWQQLTDVIRYMATTIRRCLRLRYPRGVVGFEKGYAVSPGWETYRGISSRVTFELDFECPSTTTGTHITENRTSEVEQLWRSHCYQLRPDDVKFHNPLSRFEQMFSREAVEDQLIDCTVGCETTLLKGGTPGGNRYRLGLRAAALLSDENSLDWSPHQVGEFFRTLYTLRNDVVHDDKSLPDEPSSDEFIKLGDSEVLARPFLIYARMLYADVICSYLQLISTQDSSIQEINGQIDSIMLDQSSTVREQVFNPPDQ